MTRITCIVPESMIEAANHLALSLGPDNRNTFNTPWLSDGKGNLYTAASLMSDEKWISIKTIAIDDQNTEVDYDMAKQAQDAIVVWSGEETANPETIMVVFGVDGPTAVSSVGVYPKPDETNP